MGRMGRGAAGGTGAPHTCRPMKVCGSSKNAESMSTGRSLPSLTVSTRAPFARRTLAHATGGLPSAMGCIMASSFTGCSTTSGCSSTSRHGSASPRSLSCVCIQ